MKRRAVLAMIAGTACLAACGRRGVIAPPGDRPEDPRLEDFRKKRNSENDDIRETGGED